MIVERIFGTNKGQTDDGHEVKRYGVYAMLICFTIGGVMLLIGALPAQVKNVNGWDIDTPASQFMPAMLKGCDVAVPPNTSVTDKDGKVWTSPLDYHGMSDNNQYFHCHLLSRAGGVSGEEDIQSGWWAGKGLLVFGGIGVAAIGLVFAIKDDGRRRSKAAVA